MLVDEKVLISTYFRTFTGKEFLGVLPVMNVEDLSYLSVPNEHPKPKYTRVVPAFGFLYQSCYGDYEHQYSNLTQEEDYKISCHRDSYEEYLITRNAVLKNIKDNPYVIYFMGCDNGSTGMRFTDREAAIEHISKTVVYFDEVYADESSFSIN